MAFETIVIVLSVISQLYALDICNDTTINSVLQQQQLPKPFIRYMANSELWFPLMTETDVNRYGLKSASLKCGDLISANSLMANLSLTYELGWNTVSVHIEEKDTYFFDTQYDGYYEAHTFACSENIIGNYRCYVGSTNSSGRGTPLIDVLVSIHYSLEDVKDDLEACKLKLAKIAPDAKFVHLQHP